LEYKKTNCAELSQQLLQYKVTGYIMQHSHIRLTTTARTGTDGDAKLSTSLGESSPRLAPSHYSDTLTKAVCSDLSLNHELRGISSLLWSSGPASVGQSRSRRNVTTYSHI